MIVGGKENLTRSSLIKLKRSGFIIFFEEISETDSLLALGFRFIETLSDHFGDNVFTLFFGLNVCDCISQDQVYP